jgi:hypothetical protein
MFAARFKLLSRKPKNLYATGEAPQALDLVEYRLTGEKCVVCLDKQVNEYGTLRTYAGNQPTVPCGKPSDYNLVSRYTEASNGTYAYGGETPTVGDEVMYVGGPGCCQRGNVGKVGRIKEITGLQNEAAFATCVDSSHYNRRFHLLKKAVPVTLEDIVSDRLFEVDEAGKRTPLRRGSPNLAKILKDGTGHAPPYGYNSIFHNGDWVGYRLAS